MTKLEFYREYVQPFLKKNDKPYNREVYNDEKDSLQKDGVITEKQCQNWIYPNNKFFV